MITRRRFLTISAAACATPAMAAPYRWQGIAMGAEIGLTLDAPAALAQPAIRKVRALLSNCERLFSLYDPQSTLSRLNRDGQLSDPAPEFHRLLSHCDQMHAITDGHFDPTVQPLWMALAKGRDSDAARQLIGWDRVTVSPRKITLDSGQNLTLNGIAQGFATDLVAQALRQAGLTRVLVNIGEFHAGGRAWRLGISDPVHGLVATRELTDRAIATSSPGALDLGQGTSHILNPLGHITPQWSTISVEADNATVADALSTAFCHMSRAAILKALRAAPGGPKALCVMRNGQVVELAA